jgi:hypothetical protein
VVQVDTPVPKKVWSECQSGTGYLSPTADAGP